ncbi:hypothetical protein K438DRAFT_1983971 [Mycena galopus ATCC 62051]|nr:hypothetical protein K438DRAFT_1983971 [Mycena galopus ATCC 62051]
MAITECQKFRTIRARDKNPPKPTKPRANPGPKPGLADGTTSTKEIVELIKQGELEEEDPEEEDPEESEALSLLPDNRYILLGLISTSGIVYIANRERPSVRLGRVEVAIKLVEKTLKHANEGSARNDLEVIDLTSRLFEFDLQNQTKEFVQYLQYVRDILRDIAKCAKEVEEIRTKTLCIIEAERQHQFSVGIKESHEILDTITSSLTRASYNYQTSQCTLWLHCVSPSDNEL